MITLITSVGAVNLKEEYENYRKGQTLGQRPIVVQSYLLEDDSKTDACIKAIMGMSQITGGLSGFVVQNPPMVCPENPNLIALSCFADFKGESPPVAGHPRYNFVSLLVTFGTPEMNMNPAADQNNSYVLNEFPNSDDPEQPYVYSKCEVDFAVEYINYPGGTLMSETAPSIPLDGGMNIPVGNATLRFTKSYVPILPLNLILSSLNKVNDRTMFGVPTGQILFEDAHTNSVTMSDGSVTTEMELIFRWRAIDHRKHLRSDNGTFDFFRSTVGGRPLAATDLRPILYATDYFAPPPIL